MDVNSLLNNKDKGIIEIYREVEDFYISKYGNKTVLLMEVGLFFEMYCPTTNDFYSEKIKNVCDTLNIQLTKRNNSIEEISFKNPLLVGFNSISLEKFLFILLNENQYNVILVGQNGSGKNVSRYVRDIITPGVNIDYNKEESSEIYINSINIEQINDMFIAGSSMIDISTGKVLVGEFYSTKEDIQIPLDEIHSLFKTYNIKETIINFKNKEIDQQYILDYLELNVNQQHIFEVPLIKIAYQNEVLKEVYKIKSLLSGIEYFGLERNSYSAESFILLLEHLQEINPNLLKNLEPPVFLNNKSYMYIGNDSFEQLGVISNTYEQTLLSLINNCSTFFGRRMLKDRLLNPIVNKEELERRYELSEEIGKISHSIEPDFKLIRDIEKIRRKISLSRLNPMEIVSLNESLKAIEIILNNTNKLKNKSNDFSIADTDIKLLKEFLIDIDNNFNLEEIGKYTLNNIDGNFIKEKVDSKLDLLFDEYKFDLNRLELLKTEIEYKLNLLQAKEIKEIFTIQQHEKEGYHLRTTISKYKLIKNDLSKIKLELDGNEILLDGLKVTTNTTSVKISFDYVNNLSDKIELNKINQMKITKNIYINSLVDFDLKYNKLLHTLIYFIGDIDIALCNIKNANKYFYSKPEIVETENNLIEAYDLRHPLVERNQNLGIYVPNDFFFGNVANFKFKDKLPEYIKNKEAINGALLFGLNSAGKSTNTRALGLNILLAQSGFYVAASKFRFSLFDSIFTRILGIDKPTRGLSTFAVEMLELKNIFKRATKKSLVLGDEVSKGSEHLSGVSIVASAIMKFQSIGLTYLFATHLHQVAKLDKIKNIDDLINLHLDVYYDEAQDKIIYNRKFIEGIGKEIYGLEFAKSLNMDSEFIKNAYLIRDELINEESGLKQNKYNKDLYSTNKCVVCGEYASATHHIKEQSKANEFSNIEHINKNHKYNLIKLCKKHHNMVHELKRDDLFSFKQTSDGMELIIDDELKNN